MSQKNRHAFRIGITVELGGKGHGDTRKPTLAGESCLAAFAASAYVENAARTLSNIRSITRISFVITSAVPSKP